MKARAPMVIKPSPIPMRAWMPPMAGIANLAGEVPERASCSPQASEAINMDDQAAANPPVKTPHFLPCEIFWKSRYIELATKTPIIAMLKRLAPSTTNPPSWNNSAWVATTLVMITTAAHGPRSMVASAAPNRWPEVPPATVKFNICPANMQQPVRPLTAPVSHQDGDLRGGETYL